MNDLPNGALSKDSPYRERGTVDVIAFPTILDLEQCIEDRIITGAQYGVPHPEASGAFTGDVSIQMLADHGVRYVLCGHSERREKHDETNEYVIEQAIATLEAGMHPIICVGETAEERKAGQQEEVVQAQLKGLPVSSDGYTIAYEPVWAIGDNALRAATPEEAQEMHAFIRSLLDAKHQPTVRILYGGSVKPENAEDLLSQPDIDGALVGGASLKLDAFKGIVDAAEKLTKES